MLLNKPNQLLVVALLAASLLTSLFTASQASADGAWSGAETIPIEGQSASYPEIAVDAGGNATAVWRVSDGSNYRIQSAAKPEGGVWDTPATLSKPGQDAYNPEVAVGASGDAIAVWVRSDGSNYRIQSASKPIGGAWRPPTTLSEAGEDAHYAKVALDASGNATAAWQRSDGSNYRIQSASKPIGGAWDTTTTLSGAGQDAYYPEVAVDPSGNATAVWERGGSIQSAAKPKDGVWDTPDTVSEARQDAYDPEVAVDAGDDATAVWRRSDGANYRMQSAAKPIGGAWDTPVTLSEPEQDASSPKVAVDPGGNATAVWERGGSIQSATYTPTPEEEPGGGGGGGSSGDSSGGSSGESSGGGSSGGGQEIQVADTTRPSLSFKLLKRRLKRGKVLNLRFRLSENATVVIKIKRGKKTVKSLSVSGKTGSNKVRISTKGLRPGRYLLVLRAKDPSGNRSSSRKRTLRITS